MLKPNALIPTVCILLAAFLFGGCENGVEPLADNAESSVFVNGFLDTAADSQFVRLEGLRPTILGEPRSLSDATVFSVDGTDGSTVTWQDSSVVLDNGQPGHLYLGLFRPTEGHKYTLFVQQEQEEPATATTDVPLEPELAAQEPTGDAIVLTQIVRLLGMRDTPSQLHVVYEVSIPETGEVRPFEIDYTGSGRLLAGSWAFDAFLYRDYQIIYYSLGRRSGSLPLGLRSISARIVRNSDEWQHPDNPENLLSAHGFFGSVARFDLGWTLSTEALQKIGFVDEQDLD